MGASNLINHFNGTKYVDKEMEQALTESQNSS